VSAAPAIDGRRPVTIAASLFLLACSGLALFHPAMFGVLAGGISFLGPFILLVGLLPLVVSLAAWLRTARGRGVADDGERLVGRQIAMLGFIVSEVAFFAVFFVVYLQYAIFPEAAGFGSWPPVAMRPADPWGGPLLNTAILLASGACVAASHDWLLKGRWQLSAAGLAIAIALGVLFIGLQLREFGLARLGFADGIYASIFFLTTGFHGLHVIIGAVLLSICLYRVIQARSAEGVGFVATAASWYWHFVDAVWLLLFAVFYAWAG